MTWLHNIRRLHMDKDWTTIKACHLCLSFRICHEINMGCESDLKMWIDEVTEMLKTHSKLILQIYGCKAVLIVPHDFDWQNCLKSQQKIDINLSKLCQNHQELWEWLKFVSCFTEIVYKSSSLRDSAKCWRCFKLSIWQLLSDVLFNNLFSGWSVW